MHGVRDALAYGVKVDRRHGPPGRRGDRHGARRPPGGARGPRRRRLGLARGPDPRTLSTACCPAPSGADRGAVRGAGPCGCGSGGAHDGTRPIRRALFAPYDKTGLVDLRPRPRRARTSSSWPPAAPRRVLREAGLPVTPVEDVTGSPEMLDGRVKTLHPRDPRAASWRTVGTPSTSGSWQEHGIAPFDLLVGGLYPFRETVATRRGARRRDREHRHRRAGDDAGGRQELRVGRRGRGSRALRERARARSGSRAALTRATRFALAAEAYAHTAAYDAAVAGWFARAGSRESLPPFVGLAYEKVGELRYGENPHQRGALYAEAAGAGRPQRRRGAAGQGDVLQQLARRLGGLDLAAALPARRAASS